MILRLWPCKMWITRSYWRNQSKLCLLNKKHWSSYGLNSLPNVSILVGVNPFQIISRWRAKTKSYMFTGGDNGVIHFLAWVRWVHSAVLGRFFVVIDFIIHFLVWIRWVHSPVLGKIYCNYFHHSLHISFDLVVHPLIYSSCIFLKRLFNMSWAWL